MIFEIRTERHRYAEALRALVDQYIDECSSGHVPTLVAVRRLADVLEAGKLTLLRTIFRLINRRIVGTPTGQQVSEEHRLLRKRVRVMRQAAQEHAQDYELAELAYVLATINKVLGIDPKRTALLSDRQTRGSYSQLFHEVVMAAADAVLPAAAQSSEPERQSA